MNGEILYQTIAVCYILFLSYLDDVWCASYEGWPATAGGFSVTLACSSGYRGNQTRTCTADGYWSEIDDSGCGQDS